MNFVRIGVYTVLGNQERKGDHGMALLNVNDLKKVYTTRLGGAKAVSYTHLDVYKRQPQTHWP